jgi:hypothetical protein
MVAVAILVTLGRVLAHGGLAVLLSAIPATVLLSVTGGTVDRGGSATVLVGLLVAAWLIGVAIGLRRTIERRRRLAAAESRPPAAESAT